MKTFIFFLSFFLLIQLKVYAQVCIVGQITDRDKLPLPGTNVFLLNTYDGATTDSTGHFSFKTNQKGLQQLAISFIGYKRQVHQLNLDSTKVITVNVTLQESEGQIPEVVINAGAFEASDEKKMVILRVFDIATTPSAQGDIFGALGTLPGVQKVGEDGRVFVRGGESYETKTFIDGLLTASPYMSKMPDMPTRGRFSPLLFSGTLFSTGAYSAEYGQALSSIVDMKTNSPETENKSSLSIMTVGLMASTTKAWKNSSLSLSGDYITSELSNLINKQQVDWAKEPAVVDGTLMFRQKTGKTGLFKSFLTFSNNSSAVNYPNMQLGINQLVNLVGNNLYLNNTYNSMPGKKWMFKSGIAFNFDLQDIDLNNDNVTTSQTMIQGKAGLSYFLNDHAEIKLGSDWVHFNYEQKIKMDGNYRLPFTTNEVSGFGEIEYKLSRKFAARLGVRIENYSMTNETTLMPRISTAYKTGDNSQLSLAAGEFYQRPENDYLKFAPQLQQEKAQHAVMTWQYQTELRTFRIEGYLKKYDHLIKFSQPMAPGHFDYSNAGNGHAEGIDIFWRDKKTIDLSDYWISYSWINASRNYKDYVMPATPNFVSKHNLSVVFKRFFESISMYASVTYSFASNRPYHDPNLSGFMNAKTPAYHDISLSLTHMLLFFGNESALHLMFNNMPGFDNVYGYNFSSTRDVSGRYASSPIKSPYARQIVLLISIML